MRYDEAWLERLNADIQEARQGDDPIDHPAHYTSLPGGIECIDVIQHMNFCRGAAIKYVWRAGAKGDAVTDLRKAIKMLEFEIERLEYEQHVAIDASTKLACDGVTDDAPAFLKMFPALRAPKGFTLTPDEIHEALNRRAD